MNPARLKSPEHASHAILLDDLSYALNVSRPLSRVYTCQAVAITCIMLPGGFRRSVTCSHL
jgi:hypothetical protein